jgi:F0F1-type ATP synthase membrane subunit c/vacuolar-type H+-ATPase subunit K
MDAESAKYIGAGIALICLFGVSLALGNLFSSYNNAIARNPGIEPKAKGMTQIGMALIEALGIFAVVIAFLMIL